MALRSVTVRHTRGRLYNLVLMNSATMQRKHDTHWANLEGRWGQMLACVGPFQQLPANFVPTVNNTHTENQATWQPAQRACCRSTPHRMMRRFDVTNPIECSCRSAQVIARGKTARAHG